MGQHKLSIGKRALMFVTLMFLALLAGILVYSGSGSWLSTNHTSATTAAELAALLRNVPVDYEQQIRPLLDQRCVVCHGCYDAPCQLKLSSIEGLRRGGTEQKVYDYKRLNPAPPTRLFVDARSTAAWRARGFHPVLNEGPATPAQNLQNSVLYHLLQLKQQHPQPDSGPLPADFTLDLNRDQTCPTLATVDKYTREHPRWGMPYAMPNLSPQEYRLLVAWLAQGATAPPEPGPSAAVLPQIRQWEAFLNQPANKPRLVSRYLYEHLFHAHIHFAGSPTREFYRLVRSTTPPGQPVDEIPTVRPYDDPGTTPFYYRLLRYQPSIVVKNHIVYEFSERRMQRYRKLFLEPAYEVRKLPAYQPALASNPFKTFLDLPIKSRYRFLLDDARFFVEGFIKGPVCRGQLALDVIEDQFWVLFFDPEQDVFTNDARFIGAMADDLQLPAERPDTLNFTRIWSDYWQRQQRYMASKQSLFEKINTHDIRHALGYIWDGDGDNPNAALTVFRHFDSGSVAYGLVGDDPETAWIIDYPLFERIHYLLVAGFNVYGNLVHQLNTRIYMDFLRMEGEDHFLAFLPAGQRKAIRDRWYAGLRGSTQKFFTAPRDWLQVESVTGYQSDDPQQEFYRYIKDRVAGVALQAMARNQCGARDCPPSPSDTDLAQLDQAMQTIARLRGAKLQAFPDVAFLRIRMADPVRDRSYSLIRNKAYKNVTSFLADERERDRADIEQDTMTVLPWLEGSYPNFFFSVALAEVEDFARHCAAIRTHQDYKKLIDRYGLRRTNPAFWQTADWFQTEFTRKRPVTAGVFDLNRYQNR